MPALLPKIDGITAMLFHVEHSGDAEWHYRWKLTGPYPDVYCVWRSKTTRGKFGRIVSEIRGAGIEAQWRPSKSDEWMPVDLMLLQAGKALFEIRSEAGCDFPEVFTVCAPVRDHGVGVYHFPPVTVPPGLAVEVVAVADAPAISNVLVAPAEFLPRVDGLSIRNLAASTDSYVIERHEGVFDLVPCEIASGRRWFAIGADAVNPALIDKS